MLIRIRSMHTRIRGDSGSLNFKASGVISLNLFLSIIFLVLSTYLKVPFSSTRNYALLHLWHIWGQMAEHRGKKPLIHAFSKVPGPKINIQKPSAFRYVTNERSRKEIEITTPFTTAMKRIQWLGINLTKGEQDLYTWDYRAILRESKEI